jgi:tetratricopeptide (TPR) repeat protein
MKRLFTLLTLFLFTYSISYSQVTLPPSGSNQKSVVTQYIGSLAHVTIIYNSPDVTGPNGEDRTGKIWGSLVPYGMAANNFGSAKEIPWRAGANENTIIKLSHDVTVNGNALSAGKYSIHMIPQESSPWTIIFNKDIGSWGSYFYNAENDALRIQVTPVKNDFHEWLTYEFTDRQDNKATCALMWENLSIPFTIEVPNSEDLYVANLENELKSSKGFTWVNWNNAAQYTLNNKTHLDKGLEWAENAVSTPFIGQKNFATLSTKANILMAMERWDDAYAVLDEAKVMATSFELHGLGRTLLGQGMKDKAMSLFKYNHEKFKGAWPTEVGMARGYSAMGNFEKAIKHCKVALEQAPDQLNKDNLAQALLKLKESKDIN